MSGLGRSVFSAPGVRWMVSLALAAVLGLLAWASMPAHASGCMNSWTNTSGGSWSTSSNWSKGTVRSSSEEVCITASGTYTVTLEAETPELKTLTIGGSSGTQTLQLTTGGCVSAVVNATEGMVVASSGQLVMTSAGNCGSDSVQLSGGKLESHGAIKIEAGAGGIRQFEADVTNKGSASFTAPEATLAGSWTNEGPLTLGKADKLVVYGGKGGFVNATGGTVSSPGEATLQTDAFTQGAGAITGTQVLASSAIHLNGSGAVDVKDDTSGGVVLSGNIASSQKLTLEDSCAGVEVTAATGFTNAGTIRMTATSNCGYDILAITSGTLTNNGTINAEAGGGAQQDIRGNVENTGTLDVAAPGSDEGAFTNKGSASFTAPEATLAGSWTNEGPLTLGKADKLVVYGGKGGFVNATGGTVSSPGEATLQTDAFTQGAGAITGTQVLASSAIHLNGSGAVDVKDDTSGGVVLSGNIASSQKLTLEDSCAGVEVTAATGFTNTGTIRMTATSNCGYDILAITSGTLTNNGTINAEAGGGAQQDIRGNVENTGTLDVAAPGSDEGAFTNKGSASFTAPEATLAGSWTNEGPLTLGKADKLVVYGGKGGFVNATGGTVSSPGEATLQTDAFTQGAGAITGTQVLASSAIHLNGSGAVDVKDDTSGGVVLSGNIASSQKLTLEEQLRWRGSNRSHWFHERRHHPHDRD